MTTSRVSLGDEAIDDETHLVRARGELDHYAALELKRRLADAIEAGKTRIAVDLTDAAFMDLTALVLGTLTRLRVRDGALAVASEQTTVLRILGLTGMDQALDLHATVDEPPAAVAPNHEATA